jgi:hypothetical protein
MLDLSSFRGGKILVYQNFSNWEYQLLRCLSTVHLSVRLIKNMLNEKKNLINIHKQIKFCCQSAGMIAKFFVVRLLHIQYEVTIPEHNRCCRVASYWCGSGLDFYLFLNPKIYTHNCGSVTTELTKRMGFLAALFPTLKTFLPMVLFVSVKQIVDCLFISIVF